MDVFDVLIVGAGVAGSSASYYLTRTGGRRVLIVEKDVPGGKLASSYGQSRMFRRMYSEEYFSTMQAKALELWVTLQDDHGVKLLKEHGLLFYGEDDTGETVEGSIPGVQQVMDKLGIPYDSLSSDQIRSRWPATPQDSDIGCFERTAGSCKADEAISLFMREALKSGAQLVQNTRVVGIRQSTHHDIKAGMEVTLSSGKVVHCQK
eukprot:CAMPEP_0117649580 /NCGR_PEP_ID=MMETSP0804-20121206/1051_1 /TAXON_ID=1074897 /ORGANISM="Tetraselmis astigmatica, Strain CCMP880" /LENGTH=205 /DNA_ID=CAMNT_0005455333 /DNA_START=69 /DNA_END=683 /DNA_ORIENTATION=+